MQLTKRLLADLITSRPVWPSGELVTHIQTLARSDKPRFRHPYRCCRFVGRDVARGGCEGTEGEIDMYVCQGGHDGPLLRRRYGNGPWDLLTISRWELQMYAQEGVTTDDRWRRVLEAGGLGPI